MEENKWTKVEQEIIVAPKPVFQLPKCPTCKQNDMVIALNLAGYLGEQLYKCNRCHIQDTLVFSVKATPEEELKSIDEILYREDTTAQK